MCLLIIEHYSDKTLNSESLNPSKIMKSSAKILQREEVLAIIQRLRSAKKKIAFTNGCFDILHLGHVRYLREAKRQGDVLVVGMNSDGSTRRLKGPGRPLVPEGDRAEMLAALEMVDYVTIFNEDTPMELIATLEPDVLVKGADYRIEDVVGRATVEARGGRVVIIPLVEGRSTTNMIEKIRGEGRSNS